MPEVEGNIEERTRRIVGELEALVGDLVSAGTERVEAVEAEAEDRIGRYHDVIAELDVVRREIVRLEKDREQLPNLAFKANMDEDYEREDELREKYRAIRPALESLRGRVAELETEVAGLVGKNPGVPGGTPHDAQLAAYVRCREAYSEAVAPLNAIEREVGAILRPAIAPLAGGEKGWGTTLQGIRDQRASDPDVLRRSLEKRGIRVQSAVSTPKV